jgi:hypothetical protein
MDEGRYLAIPISKRKSAQHGWPPQRGKKEQIKEKGKRNREKGMNSEQ